MDIIFDGLVYSLADTFLSIFGRNIVFVSKETSKIAHFKWNHLAVVEGFNRFHEDVLHFAGAIHRNSGESGRGFSGQKEMFCSGVVVFGIRPAMNPGCFIVAAEIGFAVIEPEGDIHAGDFLQPMLRCKVFGE